MFLTLLPSRGKGEKKGNSVTHWETLEFLNARNKLITEAVVLKERLLYSLLLEIKEKFHELITDAPDFSGDFFWQLLVLTLLPSRGKEEVRRQKKKRENSVTQWGTLVFLNARNKLITVAVVLKDRLLYSLLLEIKEAFLEGIN
ncbi:hypothetical protein CEXT_647591 [Caerostris extrusa]|uniref:Uncharacterized protein n=1 Tax=Caerostris extrusa TaxID=172846 RepID=A0AAV4Y0R7_CAEEX|nr:hypothetical protein CEXT_647591 [Caerostris extrusa]